MKVLPYILCAVVCAAVLLPTANAAAPDPLIARGRYLVAFGACNDCHTPGWRDSDARVPVSKWMTGSNIGYRGPWGTVYPVNVRLWFQETTEDQWLFSVRTRAGLPPMHWHDIRFLSETDQRAIYRFIHSFCAAGKPAPQDLPPWQTPKTPYIDLVPQQPEP
jgi:hypothetical protein